MVEESRLFLVELLNWPKVNINIKIDTYARHPAFISRRKKSALLTLPPFLQSEIIIIAVIIIPIQEDGKGDLRSSPPPSYCSYCCCQGSSHHHHHRDLGDGGGRGRHGDLLALFQSANSPQRQRHGC